MGPVRVFRRPVSEAYNLHNHEFRSPARPKEPSVLVHCPNPDCGQAHPVADDHLGSAIDCPRCHTRFQAAVGRYELRQKLGEGAFGTVYRAVDPRLGREVAVKVLKPEALDSPQVQKISEEFARALENVLKDQEDAVGVAIAINGNIEEVNIYPNHALLQKLYPRLLQSYGLQATLEKDQAKEGKELVAADISKFMAEEKGKARQSQAINVDNSASLAVDFDGDASTTYYKGKAVHQQMLSKKSPVDK